MNRPGKRRGDDPLLHLERLEDEDRLAHVPVRVLRDELRGAVGDGEALALGNEVEHGLHLLRVWGRDAHEQAPGADGRYELARAVRAEDEAHVGHVLLHRPAQRGLRVARERVRLMDDDDCCAHSEFNVREAKKVAILSGN